MPTAPSRAGLGLCYYPNLPRCRCLRGAHTNKQNQHRRTDSASAYKGVLMQPTSEVFALDGAQYIGMAVPPCVCSTGPAGPHLRRGCPTASQRVYASACTSQANLHPGPMHPMQGNASATEHAQAHSAIAHALAHRAGTKCMEPHAEHRHWQTMYTLATISPRSKCQAPNAYAAQHTHTHTHTRARARAIPC